jgi:hypothetical protein
MRVGKVIDQTHESCVIPLGMAKPLKTKLVCALGLAVPAAILVGAALKVKKPPVERQPKAN